MVENTDTTLVLKIVFDGEDIGLKPEVLSQLAKILDKMKDDNWIINWIEVSNEST